jgi:hypothetical protein
MDVCTSVFEFSAPFAHVLYAHTLLRRLHTVGNECPPAQCFLHTKNESQSVIRTWQEKRVGVPSLTAAKPRLSVADSSPGGGGGDGVWWNQATGQCRRIPHNSGPRDCSSLGTLFYGQPSYIQIYCVGVHYPQYCYICFALCKCLWHFWATLKDCITIFISVLCEYWGWVLSPVLIDLFLVSSIKFEQNARKY